jgi:hypothetical protein
MPLDRRLTFCGVAGLAAGFEELRKNFITLLETIKVKRPARTESLALPDPAFEPPAGTFAGSSRLAAYYDDAGAAALPASF